MTMITLCLLPYLSGDKLEKGGWQAATVGKIERLLEEQQIPVSTAPHGPVR